MMASLHIAFAPQLPLTFLEVIGGLAAIFLIIAIIHRSKGVLGRCVVFALLLLVLTNPSLIKEERSPLKDKALVVVDESPSTKLNDRSAQIAQAASALTQKLQAFRDLDVEVVHVKTTAETDLFQALETQLNTLPRDQLAGIIVLTDGQVHDMPSTEFSVPFHVLLAGQPREMDRKLLIKEAPAYGLVDKKITLTLRVDDQPKNQSDMATVTLERDNGETTTLSVPVGQDTPLEVPVTHAGPNLFVFSTSPLPNELTPINNTASVTINGIRDRLRVLLISGQPHIGGRTWRNFLKSDPAVDLIHFTILRSPLKQDQVPNSELALIAFPVHELFEVKLKSFDLVIFDRFNNQTLIPQSYLENIASYVEGGGALLISHSTDEVASALAHSPLDRILPTETDGKLLSGAFIPEVTQSGQRHPVTSSLNSPGSHQQWGHWFRQRSAQLRQGTALLEGLNNQPLLVLNHVGKGRVAQFLSDQFWLWSRGFEGGGPQADLLRRVAHWLVQEPELDETALRAEAELADNGWQINVTQQALDDHPQHVSLIDPEHHTQDLTLSPTPPSGVLGTRVAVEKSGLYHLKSEQHEVIVLVGSAPTKEFGDMRATADILDPLVKKTGGGLIWLSEHPNGPELRRVAQGSSRHGWNWIGLQNNERYQVTGSKAYPLLPPWIILLLLCGVLAMTWRREGHN